MKKNTSEKTTPLPGKSSYMFKYTFAATLAVLLAAGTWYWFNTGTSKQLAAEISTRYRNDVLPASGRAKLSLNDGTTIILLDSVNGVLALDGHGKTQIYKENEWLSYRSADMADSIYFNTLAVSPGAQYKVILPDGSRVWLNAGSVLHYPIVFAGQERKVELTGEAYFEVAGLGNREPGYTTSAVRTGNHTPFVVTMHLPYGDVTMRTAKARFNLMSYDNDPHVRVTLLDGASELATASKKLELKPGAQGMIDSNGQLYVIDKDNREEALAWKDGMFRFRNTRIENIMGQVARWYDLKVIYKDSITQLFTGDIQRTVPISQLFATLEATRQVHFQLKNDSITVTR